MARAEFMPRLNSGSCPTSWKFDDAAGPATGAAGEPAADAEGSIAGSHIVAKTLTKTNGRRIPISSLTGTDPDRSGPRVAKRLIIHVGRCQPHNGRARPAPRDHACAPPRRASPREFSGRRGMARNGTRGSHGRRQFV